VTKGPQKKKRETLKSSNAQATKVKKTAIKQLKKEKKPSAGHGKGLTGGQVGQSKKKEPLRESQWYARGEGGNIRSFKVKPAGEKTKDTTEARKPRGPSTEHRAQATA